MGTPDDYTFAAGDQGVHTFADGIILRSPGSQTLTATDTASGITTSTTILAKVPPDHFSLDAPTIVQAGSPFTLTVTARIGQDKVATDYLGTVHFSSSDVYPGVLPSDYTFTAADNGSHTFSGVALFTAGLQTLAVQDAAQASITGSTPIAVSSARANHFFVVAPASTIAGVSFDFTVAAVDSYGNVDTAYSGTVLLLSSDRDPRLAEYTFTAAEAGTHSFRLSLFTAGSQTISVRDAGDGSIAGSATLAVSAAPADHFLLTAPASATSGQPFGLIIAALDPYGNLDVNYSGTVHLTSTDTDAGVIMPADYTFTTTDAGVRAFSVSLVTPGRQVLTAADAGSGISGSATVAVDRPGLPPSRAPASDWFFAWLIEESTAFGANKAGIGPVLP